MRLTLLVLGSMLLTIVIILIFDGIISANEALPEELLKALQNGDVAVLERYLPNPEDCRNIETSIVSVDEVPAVEGKFDREFFEEVARQKTALKIAWQVSNDFRKAIDHGATANINWKGLRLVRIEEQRGVQSQKVVQINNILNY